MKLYELMDALQGIIEGYGAGNAEVAVEGWDDNAYDGNKIVGTRFISDQEHNKEECQTVFIVTEQGRDPR